MNLYDSYPFKDAWARASADLARTPHAMLVQGPSGVGKLWLAARLAMFLLCEAAAGAAGPCERCQSCRWVRAGTHPDLRWVEPEAVALASGRAPESGGDDDAPRASRSRKPSHDILIEQVRELAAFLHVGSHRGGRRVTIVHPAEAMNTNAANALLKALEEPPGGATFILVSHEPARLPATVRSRCVKLPVDVPARGEALAWLRSVGAREAEQWLDFAGGAPLRALELATAAPGRKIRDLLDSLERGDWQAVGLANDREDLEIAVATLQKFAIDRALESAGQNPLFGTRARLAEGSRTDWLKVARRLGGLKGLARHPLNPRLFSHELVQLLNG